MGSVEAVIAAHPIHVVMLGVVMGCSNHGCFCYSKLLQIKKVFSASMLLTKSCHQARALGPRKLSAKMQHRGLVLSKAFKMSMKIWIKVVLWGLKKGRVEKITVHAEWVS